MASDKVRILHIEGRRSFRVVWTCEELGVPYELVFKPGDVLGSMMQIRTEYPLMPTSPVARIGNTYIVESGAIVDAIVARYGKGRLVPPVESDDFLYHTQWMHFAEATVMARLGADRSLATFNGGDWDALPTGYRHGDPLDKLEMVGSWGVFEYIEDFLSHHPFLGGAAFTAADIVMHYAIRGAKLVAGVDAADYPHISKWKKAVESRPAYDRAVKVSLPGGSDEFGLPAGQPLPFPQPQRKKR